MTTVEDLMDRASDDDPRGPRNGAQVRRSLQVRAAGEGGRTFIIDLRPDNPRVIDGDGDAQCTISMAASDFIKLIEGRADPRGVVLLRASFASRATGSSP